MSGPLTFSGDMESWRVPWGHEDAEDRDLFRLKSKEETV